MIFNKILNIVLLTIFSSVLFFGFLLWQNWFFGKEVATVIELFFLALSVCIFTMFIIVSILLIVERKYKRSLTVDQFEELDTGDAIKMSAVFIAGITAEILLGWVIMELPFDFIQVLIAGLILGAAGSALLFPIIRMIYRKKTKGRADY